MTVNSFEGFPPFPQDVPCVDLPKISFQKLCAGDHIEVDRYFQACKHWGFFHLDLRDSSQGTPLLHLVDEIVEVGKKVFELDLQAKNKYRMSKGVYDGYKGVGGIITDSEGTKDRFESFSLAQDHLVGLKAAPVPAIMDENMSTLRSYTELAHSILTTLLDRLDGPLDLPSGTLSGLHRITEPSRTQLRLIKYLTQPAGDRRTALIPHTDFGSITILFSKLGGLQVLPPQETTAWSYVRPMPGHAIVNLGDAMVKFTRGLLRSNVHRVTYAPGAQAEHPRFSLVYLARPEDKTVMRGLDKGSVIPRSAEGLSEPESEESVTVKEWVLRRNEAVRSETYKKEAWALTKGTEDQSLRHWKASQASQTTASA